MTVKQAVPTLKGCLADEEIVVNELEEGDLGCIDLGDGKPRNFGPRLVAVVLVLEIFRSNHERSEKHTTSAIDEVVFVTLDRRRTRGRHTKGSRVGFFFARSILLANEDKVFDAEKVEERCLQCRVGRSRSPEHLLDEHTKRHQF